VRRSSVTRRDNCFKQATLPPELRAARCAKSRAPIQQGSPTMPRAARCSSRTLKSQRSARCTAGCRQTSSKFPRALVSSSLPTSSWTRSRPASPIRKPTAISTSPTTTSTSSRATGSTATASSRSTGPTSLVRLTATRLTRKGSLRTRNRACSTWSTGNPSSPSGATRVLSSKWAQSICAASRQSSASLILRASPTTPAQGT